MGFWPLQRGTLCGIGKLIFYIRTVSQNVTVWNWVWHEILGVGQGAGAGAGTSTVERRGGAVPLLHTDIDIDIDIDIHIHIHIYIYSRRGSNMGTRPSTFDRRSSTVDRRGAGPMPGPVLGGSTVAPQTKHTSTKQTNNNKQSHTITGPGLITGGLVGVY